MKAGMKAGMVACGLAGALLLAPISGAGASTTRLTTGVAGDANAKISMKIISRNRTPKKVKAFKYKNLDHECTDGLAREYSDKVPGRIKITEQLPTPSTPRTWSFFTQLQTATTESLFVSGNPKRNARKVVDGQINATVRFDDPSQPSGETACTVGVDDFVARGR